MDLGDRLVAFVRAVRTRSAYRRTLARIRRESRVRKIRVVFVVSELAKWKCQSVCDRLRRSPLFEPVVAVCNLTRLAHAPLQEQLAEGRSKADYFRKAGLTVVDIQKYGSKRTLSVEEIGADILFYQQPWDLSRALRPWVVARRALTFYVPYHTPGAFDLHLEIGHKVLHFLFGQVVCNEATAELYARLQKRAAGAYVTRYLPFGHPTLDQITPSSGDPNGPVIYAPHFSVTHGSCRPLLRLATFLENGREILDYAVAHPEIKWIFKPHPALRRTLVESGAMSEGDVNDYYAAWDRIGESCFGAPSEYLRLFARSRALITDCGSFLTEYGCTGKPVIRLVSPHLNVGSHPAVERLHRTYYNVCGLDELRAALRLVVESGEDPRRALRREALEATGLLGGNAAEKIVCHLESIVKGD